jgi:mannose-1-phosphate guanylyltransferase
MAGTAGPEGTQHLVTNFHAVIMAGGRGQRFWPLSTEDRPKQFLDLERSGRTLLQSTFDRVLPLTRGPGSIFVATAERYVPLVLGQLPDLPRENLIVEPVGRDSAPAVALSALVVAARDPAAVMGVFSSDHRVAEPERFREAVVSASALAAAQDGLVSIGIRPDRPATGYGYIRLGREAGHGGFAVAQFVEKPNARRAAQYVASGEYVWNAGVFVWPAAVILSELRQHAPELMTPLETAWREGRLAAAFPSLPKLSIDYAVMEKTSRAFVLPAEFGWDDIGDWVALERLLQGRAQDPNTVVGTHIGLETAGNIIYTEDADDVIVTLGVENLVVVKRGNVVLLAHRDKVQELKAVLADERLTRLTVP